jgi:hypothetical protein
MRRVPPHRPLPASAAFPTDPAVLRASAARIKTACIAATQYTLNANANRDPQPFHRRDTIYASPTLLATIPICPLAPIQFP